MCLLVNLSRIQDYVWFLYFTLKKPLSDEKLLSTLPAMFVKQQKVCRYTVTNRYTAVILVNNQPDAQFFSYMFISFLYMLRAPMRS